MVFSPSGSNMPDNTNLWLRIANDDLDTAKLLLEQGKARASILHSAYATEKVAKYALQLEGKLEENDKTHNVLTLVRRASFGDRIPENVKSALALLSRMHVETSYPISEFEFDIVSSDSYAKEQYNNARIAIGWIFEQLRKQGDANE